MSDLVVVANRGPATIEIGDGDQLVIRHGAGGLAPSLARALEDSGGTFIAAAMTEGERRVARDGLPPGVASFDLSFVEIPDRVRQAAYGVVANQTLWFLYHGLFELPRRPLFDRHFHEAFEAYREYNRLFAQEISRHADEGAVVVVHDYHLSLVGTTLARERPDLASVHFTHTPFCTPEELEVLPSALAGELLRGLSSFGATGFHTTRWAGRFADCAARHGLEPGAVFAAPLGSDAGELVALRDSPEVRARRAALEEVLDGRQLLLRSDRVELSKNVLRGFLAFEELLLHEARWRGAVTFVARLYASRTDLAEYLSYRNEVEVLVERVNERFATPGWRPIELEVADDFPATVAALARYDVLLVNPIRDGMNLVAKEGPVVNERAGVLALSSQAGAFEELGADAVAVQPFDVSGTAAALSASLAMPPDERAGRAARLAKLGGAKPPAAWHREVIERAARPTAR
jgi:trehalose 6-phosphate synthase